MYNNLVKKILIYVFFVIYIFELSFSNIILFGKWEVYAKWTNEKVNINLIIIDNNIYKDLKSSLEIYTPIIQKNNSNTKILVAPIDTKIWSIAIRKIIENVYFEWENWIPSKLVWITLIWNIPIPVVNEWWYIFASMYPYTDFEKPKYIYNSWDSYRKLNSSAYDNQPEIWQSIIKFDSTKAYLDYFDKLFLYYKKPILFASPSIWYDDIILWKKTFIKDIYNFYLNKIIFAQDLNYNRFANIFVDLLSTLTNKSLSDTLSSPSNILLWYKWSSDNSDYSSNLVTDLQATEKNWKWLLSIVVSIVWWLLWWSLKDEVDKSTSNISNWNWSKVISIWDISEEKWFSSISSSYTPTMFIPQILNNWYLKTFIDLFGNDYINTIKNNLDYWWRYWEKASLWKVMWSVMAVNINDQNSDDIIRLFNDKLEKAIDTQIYKQRYYIKTPILQNINEKKNINKFNIIERYKDPNNIDFNLWQNEKIKESYTNNYFGFSASKLRSASDMSIRKWTYNNMTGLSTLKKYKYNWIEKIWYIDDISDFDPAKISIWAGLWFSTRDVEANKWYNIMEIWNQKDKIEAMFKKYFDKIFEVWWISSYTEDVMQFFSPLKLIIDKNNANTLTLIQESPAKISQPNMIFAMELDKNLWWPILDIWWWRLADPKHLIWSALTNNENVLMETKEGKILESPYTNFPKNPAQPPNDPNNTQNVQIDVKCAPRLKCSDWSMLETSIDSNNQDAEPTYTCRDDKWYTSSPTQSEDCNSNVWSNTSNMNWNITIDPLLPAIDPKYDSTKNLNREINRTKKSYNWLSDNYQIYKHAWNPILERYTPFLSESDGMVEVPGIYYGTRFTNWTIAKNTRLRKNRGYTDIYRFWQKLNDLQNINFDDIDISTEELRLIFKIDTNIKINTRICKSEDDTLLLKWRRLVSPCIQQDEKDSKEKEIKKQLENIISGWKTPMLYFLWKWINQKSIENYPFGKPIDWLIFIYSKIWPNIVAFYKDKSVEISIVKEPSIKFDDTENLQLTPKRVYNTQYIYKLVDSRTYHKSPTYEELYGYDLVIQQPQLEEQILYTKWSFHWKDDEDQSSIIITNPFWENAGPWKPNLTFVMWNEVIALPLKNYLWFELESYKVDRRFLWIPYKTTSYRALKNKANSRAPTPEEWPFYQWWWPKDPKIIIKKWAEIRVHGKTIKFTQDVTFEKYDDLWSIKYRPVKMVWDKKIFYSIWRAGGINEVTDERPIDTPRSVNFQWIWWSLINFNYPNLWNVNVFDDKWSLMSTWEIQKEIKKYLSEKVWLYNKSLKKQLDNQSTHYQKLPPEIWNTIAKVDPSSVPNRSYELIKDDFLEQSLSDQTKNLISDDAIVIVANNLYYKNLPRAYKPSLVWWLVEDTKTKYAFADISNTIKYITEKYITSNRLTNIVTQKDILYNKKDLWDLILPQRNQTWYEIWYINSDNADFWNTDTESNMLKSIMSDKNNINQDQKPKLDQTNPECWTDSNWTVFITKWPKAWVCRFKNLKNYSLLPKITFGNWSWFKQFWEDRKTLLSWVNDVINEYTESRRLLSKSKENQKLLLLENQKDQQSILWIINNLSIINNSTLWLDDITKSWKSKIIEIWLLSNISRWIQLKKSKFDLFLSATWVNCPIFNWSNLCKWETKIWNYDLSKLIDKPQIINLWLSNNLVWSIWLYYKICIESTNICQYIDKDIQILPGDIKNIQAITPIDNYILPNKISIVRWSKIPLKIYAFDNYKNLIDTTSKDYYFWVDNWLVNYQSQNMSWFTTNTRSDLNLVYDSSIVEQNKDLLWVYNISGFIDNKDGLTNNQKLDINLLEAQININNDNLEYRLPNLSSVISPSPNNISSQIQNVVIKNNIPYFEIKINDWEIWSTANIYSFNKLVIPGFVNSEKIKWYSFDTFSKILPEQDITITWTKKIYLYPNMIAWNDQIIIQIGKSQKIINIKILPADPKKISIILPKKEYKVDEKFKWKFLVQDTRWNQADKPVNLTIWLYNRVGSKDIIYWNGKITLGNIIWSTEYEMRGRWPWWNGTIYSYISDTLGNYLTQYTPDYQKIIVNNRSRPTEDLDIMYLNLFGNDWWNLRWNNSDVKDLQNILFTKSSKLLSLTTLLQIPSKINKSIISISSKLQITSPINWDIYIQKQWEYLWVNNDGTNWFLPIIWFDKFDVKSITQNDINTIQTSSPTIYIIKRMNNLTSLSLWNSNLIVDWKIYDRWKYDNIYIKSSNSNVNWYNIYNLYYNNNVLADIIIAWDISKSFSSQDINNLKDIYQPKWYDASWSFWLDTSTKSIQITSNNDNLWSNKSIDSVIENSDNHLLSVGFGGKFSNISNFSNWQNVWQSTIPWASEFMVNFGDPYVSRVSNSWPVDDVVKNRDWWQWLNVYSTDTNIVDVKPFSLDGDTDKELLVVDNKWSIKFLKNFGWRDNWKDYWNIINIADWIKKIRIWDTDGNGYEDIIVLTNSNKIRVYKNFDGKIDVDWNQICLDIAWWPDNVKDIFDMEVYDFNWDWSLDIAINDIDNRVKIFWWWKNLLWDNYVSKDKYTCDKDWKTRQIDNISEIDWFKLKIQNWTNIYDDWMMRRQWMWKSETISTDILWKNNIDYQWYPKLSDVLKATDEEWWPTKNTQIKWLEDWNTIKPLDTTNTDYSQKVSKNSDNLQSLLSAGSDVSNLKIDPMLYNWAIAAGRLTKLSNIYSPIYDQWILTDYIYYINRKFLWEWDKIGITKTYEDLNWWSLDNGDEVKITTNFVVSQARIYTYLDKIEWPRELSTDQNDKINWRQTNGINDDYKLSIWDKDYWIIMDNMKLWVWNSSYSYIVKYISPKTRLSKMVLNKKSYFGKVQFAWDKSDNLTNIISLIPTDDCKKFSFDYSFDWGRSISKKKIDLLAGINLSKQSATKSFNDAVQKTLDLWNDLWNTNVIEVTTTWENNPYSFKKNLQEKRNQNEAYSNRWWIVESISDEQSIYFNFNLKKIPVSPNWITNFMNHDLNQIRSKLCNWFSVWNTNENGSSILSALPSSMAFLSPGIQNFMWCELPIYGWSSYDKWIPIFAALTNAIPFVRPPIPTWAWWWFPWLSTSMIRIYISPTTTAWLWFAICLWPEDVGKRLPKILRDVVWNCIVFATKIWPKWTPEWPITKTDKITVNNAINTNQSACSATTDKPLTPFILTNWGDDIYGNSYSPTNSLDAWWLWNMFLTPISIWWTKYKFRSINVISVGDFIEQNVVNINEPDQIQPKIMTDSNKNNWLVACLTTNFLWPQIEYIKNNLTKFWVNVYLPNISNIFWQYDSTFAYINSNNRPTFSITWNTLWSAKKYREDVTNTAPTLDKLQKDILQQPKIIKNTLYTGTSWQYTITKALNVLSTSNFQKLNDGISDPFSNIKERLDKSFNTQIITKRIYIDVPVISSDNILEAKSYFNQWIAVNDATIDDYKNVVTDIQANCSKKYWGNIDYCQSKIKEINNVIINHRSVKNSILQNVKNLELYSEYPLEIYRLIKLQDQYLVDIANFFNYNINYLSSWLTRNINIISSYLDTFTTMIWVIKSRQVLVNIWVNFKSRCSTCTVDNYSYYSCSFKWFCPKFPIFKIPPFKLPRITLDFSQINLWAFISIPKYVFRPKNIDTSFLFQLPNLPNLWPFGLDANIKLPTVPIIPPPPNLSFIQLPNFIPQIKRNLPTLPPAPRIPKINPEISLAVDVIDVVWQIYCLIKKWLPLVWEKWVKNKIEQLTQRSRSNNLFDFNLIKYPVWILDITNLNSTVSNNNNAFDFRIESQIDFKANFEWVYNVFDNIAKSINLKTKNLIKEINNQTNNITNEITTIKQQVGIPQTLTDEIPRRQIKKDFSYNSFYNNSKQWDTEDYKNLRYNMTKDRSYLKNKLSSNEYGEQNIWQIDWLLKVLGNKSQVRISSDFNNMVSQVNNAVDKHLQESKKIQNKILYNYDQFLKDIQSDQLVNEEETVLNTTVKVFDTDANTKQVINNYENPNISYLKLNKKLVDWYKYVLQNQPEKTLLDSTNISLIKNESIRLSENIDKAIYILSTKNIEQNIQTNIDDKPKVSKLDKNLRIADCAYSDPWSPCFGDANAPDAPPDANNTPNTSSSTSQISSYGFDNIAKGIKLSDIASTNYKATDDAAYVNWLFIKWYLWFYFNILTSQARAKEIKKTSLDMNGDGLDDIILRNNNNIWIKYQWQSSKPNILNNYQWYYELWLIDDINKLDNLTNGVSKASGKQYKIRAQGIWAYNFESQWQEYDNISYKWTNDKIRSQNNWWYIFRYTNDIQDYGKENNISNAKRNYIILMPNIIGYEKSQKLQTNMDNDDYTIKSEYISDLQNNKKLESIKSYNIVSEDISTTLSNIERKRYYAQVAKIQLVDNIWKKWSSRTSQRNWWPQMVADKESPTVSAWLGNGWWDNWDGGLGICEPENKNLDIKSFYENKIFQTWNNLLFDLSKNYQINIKNKTNKNITSYKIDKPNIEGCIDWLKNNIINWALYLDLINCNKQNTINSKINITYSDWTTDQTIICIKFEDKWINDWTSPYPTIPIKNWQDNSKDISSYLSNWISLIRTKTNRLISNWYIHNANILTNYTLSWYWLDNAKFAWYERYIQLQSWQVLNPKLIMKWSSNSQIINIPNIYSYVPTDIYYVLIWKDAAWNSTKITAKINLSVPDISIKDIYKKDGLTAVKTQVESQMDDASIIYQKNTDWQISQLISNDNIYKYNLWLEQTALDGWLFKFANGYKLSDGSGKIIWFIFDEGNIYILDKKYNINTDISTNKPINKIVDSNWNVLFDIYLEPKELKYLKANNTSHQVVRLPRNYGIGNFGGWYCLSTNTLVNWCKIFFSTKWEIGFAKENQKYNFVYSYEGSGVVKYNIYESKTQIWSYWLSVSISK